MIYTYPNAFYHFFLNFTLPVHNFDVNISVTNNIARFQKVFKYTEINYFEDI